MRSILGKTVWDTVDEWVDAARTAMLLVDIQNDYIAPGGAFARERKNLSMARAMVPQVRRLLDGARETGVMRVFIQQTLLERAVSESPSHLLFRTRDGRNPEYAALGTWGHEVVEDLAPQSDELRVLKFRSSAFVATNLDMLLRSNGIRTVVVVGLWSDGCVFATASHASWLDYYVVVPEDCIAASDQARHAAALTLLRARHPTTPADEIIAAWKRAPGRQRVEGYAARQPAS